MNLLAEIVGTLSPDEWQAAAAVGTLAVALVAAVVALFQVREAARLRREQSMPYVVVYLDRAGASIVELVVKNFGTTAARDVRLVWDRPAHMRWQGKNEPLNLFDRLPLLAPGAEWRSLWDFQGARLEENERAYTVRVSAKDSRGRRLPQEEFVLDTRHFANELRLERKGVHEIGNVLEKIERTVAGWAGRSR